MYWVSYNLHSEVEKFCLGTLTIVIDCFVLANAQDEDIFYASLIGVATHYWISFFASSALVDLLANNTVHDWSIVYYLIYALVKERGPFALFTHVLGRRMLRISKLFYLRNILCGHDTSFV